MEKETIILEVKKSKNGVAVEILEGTTLDVIIGIADIEKAVKVLEEGGKEIE